MLRAAEEIEKPGCLKTSGLFLSVGHTVFSIIRSPVRLRGPCVNIDWLHFSLFSLLMVWLVSSRLS